MKRLPWLPALLVLTAAPTLQAQTAEDEVHATIDRMFDGMRTGDSTAVRAVFHADARLMTTGVRDGTPMMQETPIDRFVAAVGMPHDEVWDERISDVVIHVDDNLATAWMNYSFYRGDEFSHCGVNAFQFFRAPEGWQVIQITDTRRQENCEGQG